ncbi:MAG: DedA family protein [Betaproteobacteria bacterium]|nr:DedA family protein [Betaproteobacteria bacterium]
MISDELGLGGLFLSSFLAATLLPGGSEAILFGLLKLNPGLLWPALALATLGNTLGGMSSYLLGRFLPEQKPTRGLAWVQRYGSPALLLAWAPLVGDALCVAAGWLRLNALYVAVFMAVGKLARYLAVAWAAV